MIMISFVFVVALSNTFLTIMRIVALWSCLEYYWKLLLITMCKYYCQTSTISHFLLVDARYSFAILDKQYRFGSEDYLELIMN